MCPGVCELRIGLRLLLFVVALSAVGCRSGQVSPAGPKSSLEYPIRGVVEKVEAASGGVLLKHEAIPEFMPAMTMEYPLENPSELSELHAGDRITATLLADPGPNGPHHLRLSELDVVGQAKPDESVAAGQFHLPQVGETVPDFVLLDQSEPAPAFAGSAREGGSDDVHLYALPGGRLLPADESEFRADRRGAGGGPGFVRQDASAVREF